MGKLNQCYLCAGPIIEKFLTAYDRQFAGPDDYVYSKCRSCGLVFMNPLPKPEQISAFYPREYSPHQEKPGRGKRKSGRNLFKSQGSNRLLEVGCGTGSLLKRHQELGWNVRGVEINSNACGICRSNGLEVHCGTLLDAPFDNERFDVIFFNHVIEHLLDPVAVFKKAADLLAASGKIILLTPNNASLSFGKYGSAWYHLDAPRHIFLYGPESLRELCAKTGLSILDIRTLPSSRIWTQSEHLNRFQGAVIPQGLEERKKIIETAGNGKKSYRIFRAIISPVCFFSAKLGRGENLRAELIADTARK
ncbi:MAG TPA: hypothetical protein DCZ94_02445 [Lentisphaeria bacterium]|nr:MAG: hypothetical protein A2X48_16105 [Lentisphaerae bacterium GWF2_49_21]HBC85794.1 hypothetical protein [Lentisphaeria bacterium]